MNRRPISSVLVVMATLLAVPASLIAKVHTFLGASAFLTALFIGWASGLWVKLCENAVARWPVEWFPSVSATYVCEYRRKLTAWQDR